MKNILRKTKEILKDKRGVSNTITMLWAVVICAFLISIFIGISDQLHQLSALDQFADELVAKASLEGKCAGVELDERYAQLCESTKITPAVSFQADYYNSGKKRVQYGDSITVELSLQTKLIGWGDYYVPITYTKKATSQSMQYWKE